MSTRDSAVGTTVERCQCPLFSIVWYGSNRVESARETIRALRAQSLGDYELVVSDCGSTDGTLELFRDEAHEDHRIRIFQDTNTGQGDALLRAFNRCRGEYIAICPSKGYFLPHALKYVAGEFANYPTVGGIATAGFLTNVFGDALGHADIITLLFTNYRPFLPALFLRREAFTHACVSQYPWLSCVLPLDLSCRLATGWGLVSSTARVVECSSPFWQVDEPSLDVDSIIDDTVQLIERYFTHDPFFAAGSGALLPESKATHLSMLRQQYRAFRQSALEERISNALSAVARDLSLHLKVDHRTLRSLHRLICTRGHKLALLSSPIQKLLASMSRMTGQRPIDLGYKLWDHPLWGYWLLERVVHQTSPGPKFHAAAPSWGEMYADLYALAAERFEARGQIELALSMWDLARPPDNEVMDSMACQAMLKSPLATDSALAARQRSWVRRYLGDPPAIILSRSKRDKIRIGYHCGFMYADTMRNMMRNVIASHDRDKFEIYGYSPRSIPHDIEEEFDVWRHTPTPLTASAASPVMTDEQFTDLLRSDGIDVLVELTGFSPDHRFGAMSRRCAPIQVSFLNHTGTSQVPNVDYVLADEICIPLNSDAHHEYSEEIYRLPGCFFCFDYTSLDEPPISDAPHLKKGHVTFGCFGTGAKINRQQVKVWADLVHRVPNSILRIQNPQLSLSSDRRFMEDRFRACGVAADRLDLRGGVDRATLLGAYSEVDISLDTWPYCGGNTIAESLWHGVPVVTYRGDRFASTYGASLVTAAGCADLVAQTHAQYIDLAAQLATDSDRLVYLRRHLRKMSIEFGLGDSKLFAHRLEEAFVTMLDRQHASYHATSRLPPTQEAVRGKSPPLRPLSPGSVADAFTIQGRK